jgi:hypothetical protein
MGRANKCGEAGMEVLPAWNCETRIRKSQGTQGPGWITPHTMRALSTTIYHRIKEGVDLWEGLKTGDSDGWS